MAIIKKLQSILNRYSMPVNKYVMATIVFVMLTFFIGDSTLYIRFINDSKINDLKNEIEYFKKSRDENIQKLEDLQSDNESLERFAREQFFMTKPNEDLFIIKP
ncbi:hypothetical protein AwDysgo_08260 [Bacteroidales bacterium]|nr:hypothetical protein AwDysgo_08260 [Bacteroidales bacterium]